MARRTVLSVVALLGGVAATLLCAPVASATPAQGHDAAARHHATAHHGQDTRTDMGWQ